MTKLSKAELERRQRFQKVLDEIKPIPGFDSAKWLRKVRRDIQRKTEGMTDKEVCDYFNQAGERFEKRRAELEKAEKAANKKSKTQNPSSTAKPNRT